MDPPEVAPERPGEEAEADETSEQVMTAETSDADPLPLRPEKTAKSMMISLPPYP